MKDLFITFKTNSHIIIHCEDIIEKDSSQTGDVFIFFKLNGVTIGSVRKSDILAIEDI